MSWCPKLYPPKLYPILTAAMFLMLGGLARAQATAAVDPIIPGLHDTGVDDDNRKLKPGEPDPHFHVTGPVGGTPRVIGPNTIPKDWLSRQDDSQWISIAGDTVAPEGTYRYEMRIDLTGFDPSRVVIDALWAVDNAGAEIYLNGQPTGIVNATGPGDFTPFTLNRGFVAGQNSIEFVVPNFGTAASRKSTPGGGGGAKEKLNTGLRFELTAVEATPANTDLAISKRHNGSFTPGGVGTYTITVSNVGAAPPAGDVVVSDTLPNGLTPTNASGSGWTCSINAPSVTCGRHDTLAAGAPYPAITLTVNVATTATSVTNVARLNVKGDTHLSNNTAEDPTTIVSAADLTIHKRHDAAFQQGKTGTYIIDVANDGAGATAGTVAVNDTVPAGLTPTKAAGTGWTCQLAGQVVTCQRSDALAGGQAYPSILLTVNVAETATTVTNTVTVSGGGDTNTGNNTATDRTAIGQAARDLAIAKSHAGNFTAGDTGRTFTLHVTNAGSVSSTGTVTVKDTLPTGLTPTAATGQGWNCSIAGVAVTCTRGDVLAAGQAYPDITLTVNVAATASDVVNVAKVENSADTVPGNNVAEDPVTIVAATPPGRPDLVITKRHQGDAAQGQIGLPFTIVVRNRSSVATSGRVTVSDSFPTGLTPTGATGSGWGCSVSHSQVTCNRSDALGAGLAYPDISIAANVAANATSVVNVATVSGGNDSDATNNSASDQVDVGEVSKGSPDLTITKTHSGVFQAGQQQSFHIVVHNAGDDVTSGAVTVSDSVPAGLTATSASGTGWSCTIAGASVTCSRSDALAPGNAFPTITLNVTVQRSAQSATNTATVSGGQDSDTSNNSADDHYIVGGGQPDLTMTLSHSGDFQQGQKGATYSMVVQNLGDAPTTGPVTVTDVMPAGLRARSASGAGWTCSVTASSAICERSDSLSPGNAQLTSGRSLETLGPGNAWPTITLSLDVADNAVDVVNVATVSGGGDKSPGNNTSSDATTVRGHPQLTITKHHPAPVLPGQSLLPFTLTVANNGSAPTSGTVTVTDQIPAGLTLQKAFGDGWGCGASGATAFCTRTDALGAGAVYPSVTLEASVSAAATSVVNVAQVSGGGDTTPADNAAKNLVAISAPGTPDLIIHKNHSGSFHQGQAGAQFALTVANEGSVATSGTVTVRDALPTPLRPTAASGDGWSCSIAAQDVTCTRGDALAEERSWPGIALTVTIAEDAPATVVNTATVSGGSDQTPEDNSDSDTVTIGNRAPDLTITKRHNDPFSIGQADATYTLSVANVGDAPSAGEVVVSDHVPAGLEPVAASGSGWDCVITGQLVTCRRSDSLKPGASFPGITIRVDVVPEATGGVNVTTVTGGGDDSPDNDTAEDPTTVSGSGGGGTPDLTITLSPQSSVVAGGETEYTADTRNIGSGPSVGRIVVISHLGDTLTPLVATGSGWTCQIDGSTFRCATEATVAAGDRLPHLSFLASVSSNPVSELVASAQVVAATDANHDNNTAELHASIEPPHAELRILQAVVPSVVELGSGAAFELTVKNVGSIRISQTVVQDVLPRGFKFVEGSSRTASTVQAAAGLQANEAIIGADDRGLTWRLGDVEPGERVLIQFRAIAGADVRKGLQQAIGSVAGLAPDNTAVTAAPAQADVQVVDDAFSMQQVLVGRVFEDVNGDGSFGDGDHPVAGARVISSTGQAAVTDNNGLYNLPSIDQGSVAISLDPGTVPASLTLAADGPGGASWSRLLRTPVGGGALLRQDFRLVPREMPAQVSRTQTPAPAPARPAASTAASPSTEVTAASTVQGPLSEIDRVWPGDQQNLTGGAKPPIPPRRDYESRQGPAMMIALGELAVGKAAPEMELFGKTGDSWGYGSIFYQGDLGSEKNRLTLSYDSRRHLNNTTGTDRLFELDPDDRAYPVMGDTSTRQELAQSNARLFARLDRGQSYVMYGDLIGDMPESNDSGGRLSAYSRHLTGIEGRVTGQRGFFAVRGARPTTSYARDVFSGSDFGLIALSRPDIVAGTETVALEVRDRRAPERILSRQVLARDVDYRLQPISGAITLLRDVGSLNGNLDLIQVVVTYEYEGAGVENMVASGKGSATFGRVTLGASAFTEQPDAGERFTVTGADASVSLPNAGKLHVDVPYSRGTPTVSTSFDDSVGSNGSTRADGFAISADLDQPLGTHAAVRASYLDADKDYANPFAATTTPGARYARAEVELKPFTTSRLLFGAVNERNETANVDNWRNTGSVAWTQMLPRGFSFDAGYAARALEDNKADTRTDSGLASGGIRFKVPRFEAMVRREQNVGSDDDPTYPSQTQLGARYNVSDGTSLVYSQRISDAPIRPIGDLTGFSALDSTNELNIGVESRVRDAARITSRYEVDGGITGPDAFAVIGAQDRLDLGHGLAADVGLEHGKSVEGDANDFTSGLVGLGWVRPQTFKANARYEARTRDGYTGLLTAGAAGRIVGGLTGLVRTQWLNDTRQQSESGYDVLAGLAIRPVNSDAAGLLFSYRLNDSTRGNPLLADTATHQHQALTSADGYWRPMGWLELYGKTAWQRLDVPLSDLVTDTYLLQGRTQFSLWRWADAAVEDRWLHQPVTDSSRNTVAAEFGVWPLADLRLGLGYNFHDTTDPYGRDQQGRPKGFYFTLSTKLARLFDLLGSAPPPTAAR